MKKVAKLEKEYRLIDINENKTNIYSSSSKIDCKRVGQHSLEVKPYSIGAS